MRRMLYSAALTSLVFVTPLIGKADDQQIAQEVANNLRDTLKNYSVVVKVQDGTAWLSGSVANQRQMASALQIAHQTEGVDLVVNNLNIGTQAPSNSNSKSTDSNLRQPVMQASMDQPEHAAPRTLAGSAAQREDQLEAASGQWGYNDPRAMPQNAGYAPNGNAPNGYAPNGYGQPGYAPNGMAYGPPAGQGLRPINQPLPLAMGAPGPMPIQQVSAQSGEMIGAPQPMPAMSPMGPGSPSPYRYDHPQMPNYAWPSYASAPNYAAVQYPKQYSPTAWPYIGPFYPYPQVPLGWRKVTMEWKDGWWFLDFKDSNTQH